MTTPTQPLDIGKLKELEMLVGQQQDEAILAFATWDVAGPWWKQRAGKLADAAQSLILMAERVERYEQALEAILKVRVEGWENIWAGSNRCQDIARNALSPKPEDAAS